jgi:hypothetical protein
MQVRYFILYIFLRWSWDSAVGIATVYGLNGLGFEVRVPVGAIFSHLHLVQTGSGAHPASYPMDNVDSSPGSKMAGA